MNDPLAVIMVIIMIILLLIIALLANLLVGAAGFYAEKVKKEEKEKNQTSLPAATLLIVMLGSSFAAIAQNTAKNTATASVGGMSATTLYIMAGVIFLEIIVILVLLTNLKILIAKERQRIVTAPAISKPVASWWKNWWNKANKFKPVHEEVKIDLGHDYDGIRELDNRLPPWWLYGFYITILFAVIYLWRFHVSHTAPSSKEEYEIAMVKAEHQKEAYLKKAAANVDENTVKFLTDAGDLQAGGNIFQTNCAACHGKAGEGTVGPNLTDEYWLHGGSIKDIFKTIKYGVPEKGMKSWREDFSPKQLAQLSSFIRSLKGTNPPNGKEKQGEVYMEDIPADSSSKKIIATVTNK